VFLRKGVKLLQETIGSGDVVDPKDDVVVQLRMWLRRGDPILWPTAGCAVEAWISVDREGNVVDHGTRPVPLATTDTITCNVDLGRRETIAGVRYALPGMRIGGRRLVEIKPQLAFGDRGIPGRIPEKAMIRCEIAVISIRRKYRPNAASPE
jgi:hypothetical protein